MRQSNTAGSRRKSSSLETVYVFEYNMSVRGAVPILTKVLVRHLSLTSTYSLADKHKTSLHSVIRGLPIFGSPYKVLYLTQ